MNRNINNKDRHNPDWVLLGFQVEPEVKALAAVVAESDVKTVKSLIVDLIRERATAKGILVNGKVAPEFSDKFEILTASIRIKKAARKNEY